MTLPPTLRPILERVAYAFYLLLLIGALCGAVVSVMLFPQTGQLDLLLLTLGLAIVARWLYTHGQEHWHFRLWAASLDGATSAASTSRGHAEFAALLAQFDAELEVWRRMELRRELGAWLAREPALRRDFAAELAAHPEL